MFTDCDYCGTITECFEDEGHGCCCDFCGMEHGIKPLACGEDEEYEDDGQPTEVEEWASFDPDC